ncbi:MAG: hypothetical protein ABI847_16670, partial [Anaerolineales bacterium]
AGVSVAANAVIVGVRPSVGDSVSGAGVAVGVALAPPSDGMGSGGVESAVALAVGLIACAVAVAAGRPLVSVLGIKGKSCGVQPAHSAMASRFSIM